MRRLMSSAGIGIVPALVLCLGSAGPATGTDDPEKTFGELLAKAKDDPENADFSRLRLSFAKTADYQPYSTEDLDEAPVQQELKNGERAAALQALDRTMKGRWMNPAAHGFAAEICAKLGEKERAGMHEVFMKKIVDTILGAGDGRSFEGAWPVLEVGEEYLILDALKFRGDHKQSLVEHGGHKYDVHTYTDDATGTSTKLYFNVDIPTRWLSVQLGGPEAKGVQP